ncbi:hypothetical protein [Polaromonas sp.]|uniref:hypothetical protein n=1 Tax=Polaromonas sp. TaxID=1869339 RepID=UPI003BAB896C
MTNTARHLAWGIGWLFGLPLLAFTSVAVGLLPAGSQSVSAAVSILWTSGLIFVFGSWALKDAPAHGKSRYIALTYTVAWLLILVFAVFPYLFATRGAKDGLLASLKFLALLLALAIFCMGSFRLLGAL